MKVTRKDQQSYLWDAKAETAIADLAYYLVETKHPRWKGFTEEQIIKQLNYDLLRVKDSTSKDKMNPTQIQRDLLKSLRNRIKTSAKRSRK